jgi:hypothetical protein
MQLIVDAAAIEQERLNLRNTLQGAQNSAAVHLLLDVCAAAESSWQGGAYVCGASVHVAHVQVVEG